MKLDIWKIIYYCMYVHTFLNTLKLGREQESSETAGDGLDGVGRWTTMGSTTTNVRDIVGSSELSEHFRIVDLSCGQER